MAVSVSSDSKISGNGDVGDIVNRISHTVADIRIAEYRILKAEDEGS